jgi:thiamine biosynthesis protein ThiI
MPCHLLVHYSEIALKGGNRNWFEGRLKDNLAKALGTAAGGGGAAPRVVRERGRMLAELPVDDADPAALAALERCARVPGVAWCGLARAVPRDLAALEAAVVALARGGSGTFRVDARRSDKSFPLTSIEINRAVGAAVVAATGRRVDLTRPADSYAVEIDGERAFVVVRRVEGEGGLPVGTSGKVVALLSGGIDSPVAAWRMMRRGCRVLGVHFLNRTLNPEGMRTKLDLLGAALARTQGSLTVLVVPFDDLQRAIVEVVPPDHRMVVYRRTMLRVADRMRQRENARALVTGDSVGQVASQTLDNMAVAYAATRALVLAPLAGSEKREIIDEARRIGTYEASILPHQDCCSFLLDRHPVTRARLDEVEAMEAGVAWEGLEVAALAAAEARTYAG